jgi:hypothetical protein
MQIIYKLVGKNENKRIIIHYDPKECEHKVLNMLGQGWIDCRFGLTKQALRKGRIILTDSDLVAHDDYIESLQYCGECTVVLVMKSKHLMAASNKRMQIAADRLRNAGIKIKTFASEISAIKYCTKLESKSK